ncbi:hypothetical protein V866_002106 [Kwoniella sp. B9012]
MPASLPQKRRRQSTIRPAVNSEIDGVVTDCETNENNSSRNIRTSAACKACRRRKVKCQPGKVDDSGDIGPCSYCVGIKLPGECSYAPPKDRAAFSREYVSKLEKRMTLMEKQLDEMRPLLNAYQEGSLDIQKSTSESSALHRPTRTAPSTLPRPSSPSGDNLQLSSQRRDSLASSPQSIPTMSHEDRQGSADQEYGLSLYDENGKPRWIGSHNTFSILDAVSRDQNCYIPSSGPTDRNQDIRTIQQQWALYATSPSDTLNRPPPTFSLPIQRLTFPTKQYARQLYEAFFEHLYPIMPIMSIRRARDGLEQVFMEKDRLDGSSVGQGDAGMATCFAIFAIGERILVDRGAWAARQEDQRDQVDTSTAGAIWFETAYHLQHLGSRNVDHFQVQCLTLLATYQACANQMPQAWLLAGQAVRYAMDMGYHRPTVQREATPHNRQIRRRMWWTIYGMERLLSLSLGRPSAIDDHDIDCPLPAAIGEEHILRLGKPDAVDPDPTHEQEPPEGTISGLIALTKLCRIAGKVSHLLHRRTRLSDAKNAEAISQLDHVLDKWFSFDLPQKYKDPSAISSIQQMSAVLSNTYFTVLIALHRHCLLRPESTSLGTSNVASLSKCVDTARSMIRVIARRRILITPSHHLSIMCQYLWSSGAILLLYIKHCADLKQKIDNIDQIQHDIQLCRRSLQQLSCVWLGASKLRQLLDDVQDVCLPSGDGAKDGPTPVVASNASQYPWTHINRSVETVSQIQADSNTSEWELPHDSDQMFVLLDNPEQPNSAVSRDHSNNGDILDLSSSIFGLQNPAPGDTTINSSFSSLNDLGNSGGVLGSRDELRELFSGIDFDGDAFWGLFGTAPQ